jgi:hypothetical protein
VERQVFVREIAQRSQVMPVLDPDLFTAAAYYQPLALDLAYRTVDMNAGEPQYEAALSSPPASGQCGY